MQNDAVDVSIKKKVNFEVTRGHSKSKMLEKRTKKLKF